MIRAVPASELLFGGILGMALVACSASDGEHGNAGGDALPSSASGPSSTGGASSLPTGGSGDPAVTGSGGISLRANPSGAGVGGGTHEATFGTGGSQASGSGGSTSASGSGGVTEGSAGRTSTLGGGGGGTSTPGGGTGGADGSTGGEGTNASGSGGSRPASDTGGAHAGHTGGAGPDAGASGGSALAAGSGGLSEGGAGGRGSIVGGSAGAMSTSTGGTFSGTCTESSPTGRPASGSGPHGVVIETNSDPGINQGTIYRPADLGGDARYPIFVWGEGACSRDGLSNATAMAEIASHGYFVVADGTPNGSGNLAMDRSNMEAMGAPLIAYIDWAIAENEKPCSAYYRSLDTTKIASNGFSCGGLMAQATVTDPRITTWGVTSSGMAGADQAFYEPIHTPVLFVEGGVSDMAYEGALEGYENVSERGVVVLWFSKDIGHGGDLLDPEGGDFTRINLAWLNWWLKGDETATGKGLLVGAECPYCGDGAWEVMQANLP